MTVEVDRAAVEARVRELAGSGELQRKEIGGREMVAIAGVEALRGARIEPGEAMTFAVNREEAEEFKAACSELGVTASEALRTFIRAFGSAGASPSTCTRKGPAWAPRPLCPDIDQNWRF